MKSDNLGICNECRARVPAEFFFREEQVWIRKDCPKCGATESLVSNDAKVWQEKRDLSHYVVTDKTSCSMKCDECQRDHKPNMVFLDVTNRCNMNCPICIATIRDMGFDFNPPMAYFEKIFDALGKMNPQPVVQLFGGEPTVREDLMDILAVAHKHGLKPHVVTNGLRLADEDYCRMLCEARVPLRFAFDGRSADIYEKLRGNRAAYDKKMKALENLKKFSRRKHAIIGCAAWGFNDQYMADMFQYFHDNRDLISDVGLIPLTENWDPGEFKVERHTTMEDVEKMVAMSIPGGEVEFIPAGMTYAMKKPRSFFRENPRSEVLLLAGVHPNCEAMTLLISDGKCFRGINHYLKRPFKQVVREFEVISKRIEPKLDSLDPKKFFQRHWGRLIIIKAVAPWVLRTVRISRLGGGKPIRTLARLIWRKMFRPKSEHGDFKARRPRAVMRVAMLPFEEQHSIDGARLENCKAVFAYEDILDGKVKYFPACSWYPYRNPIMKHISEKYGTVRYGKQIAENPTTDKQAPPKATQFTPV